MVSALSKSGFDCQNKKIDGSGVKLDGIYDHITKNKKRVILANLNMNNVLIPTLEIGHPAVNNSKLYVLVSTYDGTDEYIEIASDDTCKRVTKTASGGGSVETGVVKLTFTDGTGAVDATGAKDLNNLEITIIESENTIVNKYTTGYVPVGADIDIAVASEGVLSAIYKVKYVGPIAGGLLTKITLS